MAKMDKDAVKLEMDKILRLVEKHCNNPLSIENLHELEPSTDREYLEEEYRKNEETRELFSSEEEVPVLRFPDIRELLKHVEIGGILDAKDFRDIRLLLEVQGQLRKFLQSLEESPALVSYGQQLFSLEELFRKIENAIDEDGNVRDRASSSLAGIRKSRITLSARIKSRMESLVNSESTGKILQERLVTIRANRYVVPLKQEYKGRIPGIVHDQSASGATLYVEPEFAVEMNNKLKQLALDEEEEIRKILKDLTKNTGSRLEEIRSSLQAMGSLDLIFARQRFSEEIDGTIPLLNNENVVDLRQARHPLLTGYVVPNDISIGESYRTVVITGPNTGGKTIALKTLGLLALMVQFGLNLPCREGSRMALFARVFADIGDEQSIEQSLSTYSSHMTNIIRILGRADNRCLVLLDELGAGTDPGEGAALAVSILEFLHQRQIVTMATSHYGELKAFAYNNEGAENASVEFDNESLQPTYRLLMGTPGLSNALIIASKLGLDNRIIERARDYMSGDELKISGMIQDLEDKRKEAEKMNREAEELRREVDQLKEQMARKEKEIEEKEKEVFQKAYREAEEIITGAQREAEALIDNLKSGLHKEARDDQLMISNRLRQQLRQKKAEIREGRDKYAESSGPPRNLEKGENVLVVSLNRKATVLAPPDAKGEVLVQAGIMKVSVPQEDLERVEDGEREKERTRYGSMSAEKGREIRSEVDLRGLNSEEALQKLDKYLDDALLAGLEQVRVIHGKGTGTLRKNVSEYLRRHTKVSDIRTGETGEGGSGVTVAMLKK